MSPNKNPTNSAEILEGIKLELLTRFYEFILSWPMPSPSRIPEEAVPESPDSAENRDSSPNKPEKIRAGAVLTRDSSPLRESGSSAESAREPEGEL